MVCKKLLNGIRKKVKFKVFTKLGIMLTPTVKFLTSVESSQVFHTPNWLEIIRSETNSNLLYFFAFDKKEEIQAFFPVFVKDGPYGVFANSSPFFGSNGGFIYLDKLYALKLFEYVKNYFRNKVKSLTIISPILDNNDFCRNGSIVSKRTVHLKNIRNLTKELLLKKVGGLVNSNLKRKCWKNQKINICESKKIEDINWLFKTHKDSMKKRMLNFKKKRFFTNIMKNKNCKLFSSRLFIAKIKKTTIAGLLILTHKNTVEYITPAYDVNYSNKQPLTALIFESMLKLSREGFTIWSFGGSGIKLDSLTKFKDNWNCKKRNYFYYTHNFKRVDSNNVKKNLKEYEGFFLNPFL